MQQRNSLERKTNIATRQDLQPFSRALEDMLGGRHMARAGWPKTNFLFVSAPAKGKEGETTIVFSEDGEEVLWEPTQEEILAKDWLEVR